ncbi:unnamed protein product [Caenorhabditis auriculariae]|uniref:Uncharacterized protein n=1 Tax=Caenorhabditis auriculariae TaxID=2777116 RepID=A0A8S1HK62_9PELO|nr:unnamed protein product [Caenorhabditis auriculariae]
MTRCTCILPCDCVAANVIADSLGAAPEYLHKDAERWSSAAQLYEEMTHEVLEDATFRARCRSQHHSPERPHKVGREKRLSHSHHLIGGSQEALYFTSNRTVGRFTASLGRKKGWPVNTLRQLGHYLVSFRGRTLFSMAQASRESAIYSLLTLAIPNAAIFYLNA